MIDWVRESEDLIDAAYDLALEPDQFHQFAEAWLAFSDSLDHQSSSAEHQAMIDATARHIERAFLLMEKMGRRNLNVDPVDQQVLQRSSPAVEVATDGRVLLANQSAKKSFALFQPIAVIRSFADGFSHVSLQEIPNAGQLALLSQPQLVSEHLLNALARG